MQLMRYTNKRYLLLVFLLMALPFAGCDALLEVEDEGVVTEEALNSPEQRELLHASVIRAFAEAYSGAGANDDAIISLSAVLSDEFIHTGNAVDRTALDQRIETNSNFNLSFGYEALHEARALAEDAVATFNEHSPGTVELAELHNLAGYTYIFFAENFCSGVPFSSVNDDGSISYGEPETRAEILDQAQTHFEAALTIAADAGSAEQMNLAKVGLGRVLADRGRSFLSEAASAVAGVPTEFEYVIYHSPTSISNGVWSVVNETEHYSVSPPEGMTAEGTNGLNFRADPRVPTQLDPVDGESFGGFPQYIQMKYPAEGSPIPLASGLEAELIRAEADLEAGNFPSALGRLNDLRVRSGLGLAPLEDPETRDGRVEMIFDERAFWMWATAHRLGDLRRLARPAPQGGYGFGVEAVYPAGAYWRGGFYGSAAVLQIPISEENNPNFNECLNLNP